MWQIKNPEIEKKILVFFTQEEIDLACKGQIDDEFSYVIFRKNNCLGFNEVSFEVEKEEFEEVEKYDPRAWNDFSKVKPPRPGYYCVSNFKINDYPSEVFQIYWDGKKWSLSNTLAVLSFREYPIDPTHLDGFWDTKGL